MKMRTVSLTVLAITLSSVILLAPTHATYDYLVSARTTNASYLPGDTGTLLITLKNTGSQAFQVKSVNITYPWMAFVTDHWDGNVSFTGINQPLGSTGSNAQTFNGQYSFTVPSDGRAYSGNEITIVIGTDVPPPGPSIIRTSATIAVGVQTLGVVTFWLPIVSVALIAAAVVMLALVFLRIRTLSTKFPVPTK
jgi:hypothetical protein